jgi:hypothetical protein
MNNMNNIKKALEEQAAAANILSIVDRIQHFKYLEKKFGPREKEREQSSGKITKSGKSR